ncbi:MAG: hypothetical protein J7M03_07380 [Candidatus Desulfofervidaceae bacterium]|nr:hypothetical protein [Candidatus Desulfofervidaceae bacterium]
MHYSQTPQPSEWGTSGPYQALLINNCVGCHSGTNTGSNKTPYIFSSTAPTYGATGTEGDTLAGGNFYWVANGNNTAGHNVAGICGADTLSIPPGFTNTYPDIEGNTVGGGTWPAGQQVTCAGTYGCHGHHNTTDQVKAIYGAHHTDDTTIDGNSVGTSYRFLMGILGKEDSDWEYQPTSTTHNQYYGVDRSAVPNKQTISYLCAECHGYYHSITKVGTTSPWLRHPTDFDMNNVSTKEYGNYPGDGSKTYSVIAPVGSVDVSAVKSQVLVSSGDAIVMCTSCHRAHGTPYFKLMRWNYQGSSTGGNCSICHTTKN